MVFFLYLYTEHSDDSEKVVRRELMELQILQNWQIKAFANC